MLSRRVLMASIISARDLSMFSVARIGLRGQVGGQRSVVEAGVMVAWAKAVIEGVVKIVSFRINLN